MPSYDESMFSAMLGTMADFGDKAPTGARHRLPPEMLEICTELDKTDPTLKDPVNRVRFVDACITSAKMRGMDFGDTEEEVRADAIEFLGQILDEMNLGT